MAKFRSKNIIKAALCFAILITIGAYCYFKFGVYLITTENQRILMLHKVKESYKLPKKFVDVYSTLYPSADKKYEHYLLNSMFSDISLKCNCANAGAGFAIDMAKGGSINIGLVTSYLEDNLTHDQCLNFYLSNITFPHNINGIENAAKYYYHKNIEYLSEDETIELIAMSANPFYLTKYSKRLEFRVNSLKQIMTDSR